MATSASSAGVVQGSRTAPRKSLLRPPHKRVPHGVFYALAAFGFALLVIVAQLVLYARRSEPRDARLIVERELRLNTLRPGEQIVRSVSVFRRTGADYFRATRGLLVLTDQRLIYLGAPPRDITGASDQAPTFDQQDFRIDTLVTLKPSFAVLGMSRAIVVQSPQDDAKFSVASGAWPSAQILRQAWDVRHRKLEAIGAWGHRVRDARTQVQQILEEYRKQPVYHTVRPGDAISSIASWYETPEEKIRELNGVVGNKIRVGQKLLIRGGS